MPEPGQNRQQDKNVASQWQGHGQQDPGGQRQINLEFRIQLGKPRHRVSDHISDHEDGGSDQHGGIDQRGDQPAPEAGAHAEVGDVLIEYAREISAAFTGADHGHINRRERTLRRQRLR